MISTVPLIEENSNRLNEQLIYLIFDVESEAKTLIKTSYERYKQRTCDRKYNIFPQTL